MKRFLLVAFLLWGPLRHHATAADIPIVLGVDGTWGRSELGLGARLVLGFGSARAWEAVGHFVYYFPHVEFDTEFHDYEVNANLTRSFDLGEEALRPFFGAGLNMARETRTVEQQGEKRRTFDETNAAVSLLVGMHIGYGMRGLFGEARAVIGKDTQMVVTAGLRF
ncbi:MAG: hypothetical protein JXO72_05270 [Vicinamibacteria bacterium]|nr:hypothetical protein [Vicinamibacteria bacterium]